MSGLTSPNHDTLTEVIMEKTTPVITGTLVDEDDNPISVIDIDAMTLTLFSMSDENKSIINSRDAQDILNTNGVTVDGNGVFTWEMYANDNSIYDSELLKESHRAVIEFDFNVGAKHGKHVIDMTVQNLRKTA